jgi:hypothetical protein
MERKNSREDTGAIQIPLFSTKENDALVNLRIFGAIRSMERLRGFVWIFFPCAHVYWAPAMFMNSTRSHEVGGLGGRGYSRRMS